MLLCKESRMQMAVSAYRKQTIKSNLQAAGVFEVPRTTFHARLEGRKPRSETPANSHKLTIYDEEVLVKKLLDADKRGFSIRSRFRREMAKILLCERTQRPYCSSWS
jgi:hypothetical protein